MTKTSHIIRHKWMLWFYDLRVRDWPVSKGVTMTSRGKVKKLALNYVNARRHPAAMAVYMRQSLNIRDAEAESEYIHFTDILLNLVTYDPESKTATVRRHLTVCDDDDLISLLSHPFLKNRYSRAMGNSNVARTGVWWDSWVRA